MELLKMITEYDPTGVQKKARIRRAKKILKGDLKTLTPALSWEDTKQKSSEPAQLICEWLIVSMMLRQIAVDSRKARPDIYDRISASADTEAAGSDVKINDEERADDSLEQIDQDQNGEAMDSDAGSSVAEEGDNDAVTDGQGETDIKIAIDLASQGQKAIAVVPHADHITPTEAEALRSKPTDIIDAETVGTAAAGKLDADEEAVADELHNFDTAPRENAVAES